MTQLGFIRAGILAAIATVVSASTANAQFEGTYEVAVKKQEEKKSSRWSLADWLTQKQRNRAMDLWLAKNSTSSHYEFFLEARGVNYGETNGEANATPENHNVYGGAFAAYAGVAGLKGGYDLDSEKRSNWAASLNLRLFGRAIQDTHINLEYGLRGTTLKEDTDSEFFQNQFGGVSINLYLAKSFGLEGIYQRLLPVESDRHRTMEGEDSKAGVFIDFSLLRVFGYWRHEYLHFKGGDQPSGSEFRQGFGGGLRLYF